MKSAAFLLLSLLFITACGREEPTSYQVPKSSAPVAPEAQSMGSDVDNQAVLATHAAMSTQTPSSGFTGELPGGWTEKAGSGMRKVSYGIEGTSIDFYLTPLNTGDMIANIDRWRGQVGLASVSPEEITNQVVTFRADGHDVKYIEIYNEEGGKGIIAAIVDLDPQYWYFTGKGSVAELKANASNIRKFLESIKFEGHNH